jgi:hypothetical protein
MPVEVVDIAVLKTIRNRTSPVKSSVEWQDTMKVLPELEAKQAVKIEFSPATLKLAKNVPFTFAASTAIPQERRIDRLHSVSAGQGLTGQQHLVREEDEARAAHDPIGYAYSFGVRDTCKMSIASRTPCRDPLRNIMLTFQTLPLFRSLGPRRLGL